MKILETYIERLQAKLSGVEFETGDSIAFFISLTGICSEIAAFAHHFPRATICSMLKDEYKVLQRAYQNAQEAGNRYACVDAKHMAQASIKRILLRMPTSSSQLSNSLSNQQQ